MKCEQGDLAKIIYSVNPNNIGKVVLVETYIGKFQRGDKFDFRGVACMLPVTDHYWWIKGDGLANQLGDTPKAYIADSWLEPLRPNADREQASKKSKLPKQVAA
jgi:hypothetical protein|tara:strand:+ start:292 stop:603 length:312 start_codon:yes stop_codon:yes gene_type:complete